MNSYKAIFEDVDPYHLMIDLTISLGFGLTLRKELVFADIELDFLHTKDTDIILEICRYCGENKGRVDITVNENDEVFVFNGVDNNHLNAVLVEKGYAKFI